MRMVYRACEMCARVSGPDDGAVHMESSFAEYSFCATGLAYGARGCAEISRCRCQGVPECGHLLGFALKSVKRRSDGKHEVTVGEKAEVFVGVVLACHGPQAREILEAGAAMETEKEVLRAFDEAEYGVLAFSSLGK